MSAKYEAILTFDDGPEDESGKDSALKSILDSLEARKAIGVFYLTGVEVKSSPHLAKIIVDRGHIVQSHSWEHAHLPKKDKSALTKDVKDTQDAISKATGVTPNRLRPPYGDGWVYNKSDMLFKVAEQLSLVLTGWDIDTNDWNKNNKGLEASFFSPERKKWEALYTSSKKPLDILMHVKGPTAKKLGAFMDGLSKNGWRFTTYGDTASKPVTPYYVQVAAATKQETIAAVTKDVESLGYKNVRVVKENMVSKVQVGPYASKDEATKALNVLKKKFVDAYIVGGEK